MISLRAANSQDQVLEKELPPVTRLELIKYAGASGDFNPIHTIDEDAKNAGLPGVIAHGMWTMGQFTSLFTPYYEEGFVQTYRIRFKGMVFIDDRVTLRAKVKRRDVDSIRFTTEAIKQDGTTVLKGETIFKLYS